jgi:glycosyltransferase involved in cell wall biosynthesis
MINSTVIIPAHGRQDLLDRAIKSILDCNGSELVQVIVIDDGSPIPIQNGMCRPQDHLLRNETPVGAAVSRNMGIDLAIGDVIYLLDSDDYIIERDFINGFSFIKNSNALVYSTIYSQNFSSCYPELISKNDFFYYIFFKFSHIAQTSSLAFSKKLGIRFDESLPKHQDWDLVFTCLINEIPVIKGPGSIFFDRSDKGSLSRTYNGNKSIPWFDKLSILVSNDKALLKLIKFYIFSKFITHYSWKYFIFDSSTYLFTGKLKPVNLVKLYLHRFMQILK